ncbi:MAG: hypothetical protein PSN37_04045, partial [Alphaproteobacteria bacterium]|nr:hypothetical protein [Alphaproteobacteria bacterium]
DEISLILLGPNISVPSGQKFFESLRNNDRCRHLPVAVLAASAYDEVVQRAYKNSANYIISKVDTLEGVMNTVDMIVRFWFQATHETYMK